jgi:dienelactone hydrolase
MIMTFQSGNGRFATVRIVALALALAGCLRLAASAGSDAVTTTVGIAEYNLGDTAFSDPDYASKCEIAAVVHYPRELNAGPFPLILMLHGSWWASTSAAAKGWPLPAGVKQIPSYRGYDYLGEKLAERGYVVVSIGANGINAGSMSNAYAARAHLINRHLRLWQELASTGGGPLAGMFTDPQTGQKRDLQFRDHVDLTRVGTMGHSRGGKAVMWQAADKHRAEWPAGVTIRAVVPLAGVKFDEKEGDNSDGLVTGIPFAVVTSTCDGAVKEVGRQYFDEVAGLNTTPVYWLSLHGANHNAFNTEWIERSGLQGTKDDCTCPGSSALSAGLQRQAAVAYLTAFYDRHLKGETGGDALLTGAAPLPVPGVVADARVRPPAR